MSLYFALVLPETVGDLENSMKSNQLGLISRPFWWWPLPRRRGRSQLWGKPAQILGWHRCCSMARLLGPHTSEFWELMWNIVYTWTCVYGTLLPIDFVPRLTRCALTSVLPPKMLPWPATTVRWETRQKIGKKIGNKTSASNSCCLLQIIKCAQSAVDQLLEKGTLDTIVDILANLYRLRGSMGFEKYKEWTKVDTYF